MDRKALKSLSKDNPRLKSNFLSRVTFHYLNSFISLGSRRPIIEEDLWEPTPENKAATICEQIEKTWNDQLKRKSPSFGLALFHANKNCIGQLMIYQCLIVLLQFSVPIVMGYFIDWFSDPQSDELPKIMTFDVDGYIWAALLSFLSFLCAFQHYPFFQYQRVKGGYFSDSDVGDNCLMLETEFRC